MENHVESNKLDRSKMGSQHREGADRWTNQPQTLVDPGKRGAKKLYTETYSSPEKA